MKFTNYINKEKFNSIIPVSEQEKDSCDKEAFSLLLHQTINVIRCQSDDKLYIYNHKGYYEELRSWLMKSIIKYILNTAGYAWSTNTDKEIIGAFERDCTTVIKEFNTENAINLKNGVFSLDSMEFREHSPKTTHFTCFLDYKYNEHASCTNFDRFINETACNDKELIDVLQEIVGYSLSTRIDAEKAFYFYGTGCNGKSLLGSVIHSLVGQELSCAVSLDGLNSHFSLSELITRRVNIASENEKLTNSERLKSLISCDRINVPIKYKSDWSGKLYTKHIFLMNTLPVSPDITPGYWRKIMIVPFNNAVKSENIDKNLFKTLTTELSGILNWALAGYRRLADNGFVFSNCVAIDTCMQEYKCRENPTGAFFNETYIVAPDEKIKKSSLYDDYVLWCRKNDAEPMDRTKFLVALKLKSEEANSNIKLDYARIHGINYLKGYKKNV